MSSEHGLVQIGDLSRRVGVRVDTLRAWERRYGLLRPHRSSGGFRLYSSDDEATVRAMVAEIDRGYPPSQAAKLALARTTVAPSEPIHAEAARAELVEALQRYDGARAHALLDAALSEFSLNAVLRDFVLPCLAAIGDAWARGELTVAEEHFASQLIRERLLGLARDWDQGRGPRALLACPAGERHDIALICFGLVLSRGGWRITFLGPDTPDGALTEVADELSPDLVVLAATVEDRFSSLAKPLRALAAGHPLALAGPGATPDVARATGTTVLEGGPVPAALELAAHPPRRNA